MKDPIIDEIKEQRKKLAESFSYDIDKMIDYKKIHFFVLIEIQCFE